jgi:hypothetical protein
MFRGAISMFALKSEVGFNVDPRDAVPGFRVEPAGQVGLAKNTANPFGMSTLAAPGFLSPFVTNAQSIIPTTYDNCPEIIANCKAACVDRYEMLGGDLGFVWMRRCIRDCVEPSGCS